MEMKTILFVGGIWVAKARRTLPLISSSPFDLIFTHDLYRNDNKEYFF